jgi:IS1 family transposase
MICSSDRSRARRERVADVLSQFLAGLVETDDWTSFVVRFFVE